MNNELPNLCPECGMKMTPAGMRWSGRHLKQSFKCASTKKGHEGCGRVTFHPVHTWQQTLFGAVNHRPQVEDSAPPEPAPVPQTPPPDNHPTKNTSKSH